MSKIPKDMKEKGKFQEVFEENPELKQLAFFAFYIVFFIFIVVLLRSSVKTNSQKLTRYNSGYNHDFNLKSIANKNYHFNYKVTKNNETYIFDGDRNEEKQTLLISGEPALYYYSEKDKFYMRNPNTLIYEESNNPMEFSNLIEQEKLEELFTHATYISKTEYLDESQSDYTYEISTSTMLRNFNNQETDIEDSNNKIIAKTDNSRTLYEIELDFSNYYHYFDNNINEYKLILTYSKFGEISPINIEK